MNITLYNNKAEKNRVNKGAYLSRIITMTGTLRESCSVTAPSILIELDAGSLQQSILKKVFVVDDSSVYATTNGSTKLIYDLIAEILTANYVYIKEFDRYYFVTDIISEGRNLWRLNMSVDVLMSFMGDIKDLYAFVTRNEFTYDEMIRDDFVSYHYLKDVSEYTPDKGELATTTFNSNTSIIADNYTVTVINDIGSISTDIVDAPDSMLPRVGAWVSGITANNETYATWPAEVSLLSRRLVSKNSSLAEGVLSIIAWPFEVPHTSSNVVMRIKTTDLDEISGTYDAVYGNALSPRASEYFTIADFTISGTDSFLDYEPYTIYEMYLPYCGWITLSADDILNVRIIVTYVVNYTSGSAQVSVLDISHGKILFTSTCQLGVSVPVTSTNAYDVENNKLTNNISLGLGLASSVITTVAGVVTENPMLVAGGIMGAAKSVSGYVSNTNSNYVKASGSISSGVGGVYLPQDVRIRTTKYVPKDYDSNYAKFHGRPYNTCTTLGSLTGYTEVGAVHVENIPTANDTEINQIETLLKNGIIL